MNEEDKKAIEQNLNLRIGGDINELKAATALENELVLKRDKIQGLVSLFFNFVKPFLSCLAEIIFKMFK